MRLLPALLGLIGAVTAVLEPNYTSPAGVEIYNPSTFFNTTGPWSLMSKAGNTLYIAGTHVVVRILGNSPTDKEVV
jgi:hypothetical protein